MPFVPAPPITATQPLTGTALAQTRARHHLHHAHARKGKKRHAPPAAAAAVVQLAFVGANAQPHIVGVDALPGTDNYLLGRQRAQWHTRVPTYAQISYQGVYPGIDLVYHGRQGHLEYDWRLAPHATVRHIQLAVHGATGLRLDSRGTLVIGTQGGAVRQDAPVAYQEINGARRPVAARYVLLGARQVGLTLGAYDRGQPLVIDPVLSYATYLGGSDVDQATGIAVDGSGNIYVAGDTLSTTFPTTTGAYSTTLAGGTSTGDAFVSKLSADGSTLLYSTYLGGSGDEDAWHVAVDGAGEAEVVGYTNSTNYPTVNAAQNVYGGGVYNAFASKLSADGSALVYSTYLGGNGDDEAYGLAVDSAGDAYVAGLTDSTNFPLKNALQSAFSGVYDAFVTEFDPNGALLYSTYLGGSGDNDAYGIAIDGAGNAYVTGATTSPDFPVSATAYQRQYSGVCSGGSCAYNAFVAKIAAGGTGLLYSTYLGGGGDDEAEAITVDGAGNAWVTGNTASTTFPTTGNAIQTTNGGNPYAVFVAELTADGSALPYATYLGGSGDNESYAIALDSANNVYITGETSSTNFPTTGNATQATYGGGAYNAFVSELTAAGGTLAFSTYLGGSGDDAAFGIAVAPDDSVDVAGLTASSNFPTVNPLQAANAGSYDAFVAGYSAPAPTCPSPWLCDDIGSPPLAGDQTLTNGTWTIHGSGGDIWNASDQFHFVWQSVSGDSSIVARLTSQQNTSICTKAGIMYRASTDPADVNYSVVMLPDCHFSTSSIQVNARSAVSATATTANDTPTTLPVYLKATRTGNTFTAYTSSDGATWTQISNSAVSLPNMPTNTLVGLVVCSQNSATTSQATFDNVNVTGTADLAQQDTSTAHYTQTVGGPSGTTSLQYYNSPAGTTDADGWHPINLALAPLTGTGMLAPANVPYGLQLASSTSMGPSLASLTTEDGVTVGVGLAAAAATPVAGQIKLNSVTFPSLTIPVVLPTVTATITATPPPTSTPVNAAGGVNVYIGYADSLRPNPNLPVPWQGAPNTGFVGHPDSSGAYDSGAIRLDNTTATTITIKDATVVLHTVNNDGTGGAASGQTFDLWGSNTIAPNSSLILAATGPGDNFDTSDFPLAGTSCTSPASPTTNPPHITLTFGDNSQATITDTAHVLDTGGYDTANCPSGNESLQWRALGTTGVNQASGSLTLATPSASPIAGTAYNEVATLSDASNQPQPNVAVNFSVTSGPNAGLTGQAVTDSQGHATFTYTSTVAGTDTIAASITNASGGIVNATPVNVTWAPPPVADVSLQAVSSGLNVRLVLHDAKSSGPFTLALAPDPTTNTQFTQNPDGSIDAIQPITTYGHDGMAADVLTQTEYMVQPPVIADSSTDPAAPANVGPVTSTLVSTGAITHYVSLAVDPVWLNDSHRVFPVTLNLPIETANAALQSGVFGTLNSCAPNTVAPPTDLIVGTESGCTYHGQVYFDLSPVAYDTTIASATLHLYTPNQTGATGVQVYPNTIGATDPSLPASWNTAPTASSTGVGQNGSNGNWQSWDVTSLVQQWVQDGSTNGGLTLTNNGNPIRFAAPLGSGSADSSLAPYLTITTGSSTSGAAPMAVSASSTTASTSSTTASTAPGLYNDGMQFIYGDAGQYDSTRGCPSSVPHPAQTCPNPNGQVKMSAVGSAYPNGFGGQMFRLDVHLACPSQVADVTKPSTSGWWASANADPNNTGTIKTILAAAAAQRLTPILNLLPDDACSLTSSKPTPSVWFDQAKDLVTYLYANSIWQTDTTIYFEIGNEANFNCWRFIGKTCGEIAKYTDGTGPNYQDGTYHYPSVFAHAAQGILMASPKAKNRIITAGLVNPTAARRGCSNSSTLYDYAGKAINAARTIVQTDVPSTSTVPTGRLGVGVHPYDYDTNDGFFWRNYYNENRTQSGGNSWMGVCQDLNLMINAWTGSTNGYNFHGLPLIFTETNWSVVGGHTTSKCSDAAGCQGTYLVDLFTYLHDRFCKYVNGKCLVNPSNVPIRVDWHHAIDVAGVGTNAGDNLGLWQNDGTEKVITIPSLVKDVRTHKMVHACINQAIMNTTQNGKTVKPGQRALAFDYYYLRNGGCY